MNKSTSEQHTELKGLTAVEVEESRRQFGINLLTPPKRSPWWLLYLEKYNDPVIRILLIAVVIAFLVGLTDGHYLESLGILIAVFLATTLSFLNEFFANKKFDLLNRVNDDVPVNVIRENGYQHIPRKDVVVGDLVMIETGEEVPADGQLIQAVSLQIDESRLTGESVPVTKQIHHETSDEGHQTTYAADFLVKESFVSDGHGIFKVSAVGDQTEIGKTARAAREETKQQTPLNRQLEKLGKIIGLFGFSISLLVFIALVLRGTTKGELVMAPEQWFVILTLTTGVFLLMLPIWLPMSYDLTDLLGKNRERPSWLINTAWMPWLISIVTGVIAVSLILGLGMLTGWLTEDYQTWIPKEVGSEFLSYFMISVTIIVVAIPEGLAMSVTLSLAYSMRKMMEANNLVRQMHACETIGAATVICTDKTGTLTRNEMAVHTAHFNFQSNGLDTSGQNSEMSLVSEAIAANSTAQLDRTEGIARVIGNPTEGALLLWLNQIGADYEKFRNRFEIKKQWTFNTERKFMATLGQSPQIEKQVLYIKGAPEIVLQKCKSMSSTKGDLPLDSQNPEIIEQLKSYQKRGMRTLAFAMKDCESFTGNEEIEKLTTDMVWLGYVAIADPVRDEVPDAITSCKKAGIQVKVITGDVAETASEIGRYIGLLAKDESETSVMTGPEFGKLSEKEALTVVPNLKILSRARPMDKLRMVKLLQSQDQVVAVTGDGTNDAPALNHADVGLAMGKTGTAVAKEASDIVLLDDSFKSITNAVMWGRSLYQNIQRFVLFQITINVTALLIALVGPFIGVKLPLTVIQMLWINLIMDTFAALALATEPPNPEVMDSPPRKPTDFIILPGMLKQIIGTAVVFFGIVLSLLIYFQDDGSVGTEELSIVFTLFVLLQFWNLFNAKSLGKVSSVFKDLLQNKAFLIIAGLILGGQILIVSFGGSIFRTVPLKLETWLILVTGSSVVLWVGELVRFVQRKKRSHE